MTEVWSDGGVPFGHLHSVADVAVAVVRQHHQPSIPKECPKDHADLMQKLLSQAPSDRPKMAEVHDFLLHSDQSEQDGNHLLMHSFLDSRREALSKKSIEKNDDGELPCYDNYAFTLQK